MEKIFNYQSLEEFVKSVTAWANASVLSTENIVQSVIILVALLIALTVAPRTRTLYLSWLTKRNKQPVPGTIYGVIRALIFPVIWLLLLWFCVIITSSADWPQQVLVIAVSLLNAWVVIRFTAILVRNPFMAKTIAAIAWTVAALNILDLLKPAAELLDSIALKAGNLNVSLLSIIQGFIYLIIFLWLAGLLSRFAESRLKSSTSLTPSMQVLTGKIIRIVLMTVAFLLAISSVGIDLTVFTVFGGALGVGLGFGLQKVVSNFISGIILLMDKSIKPGDVISVGNTYGWVNSLNARYVSLDTRDGVEHLIPNEELIINRVENWSHSNKRVRLKIPVGVHYQADVYKAIDLCLESVAEVDRALKDPEPVCQLKGFGDSSVDLEIRFYIEDPEAGISNIKSEVLLNVWKKFHECDIEIPYPQRDLHIKTPIQIKND